MNELTENNFTEAQLMLLKLAINLERTAIETIKESGYEDYLPIGSLNLNEDLEISNIHKFAKRDLLENEFLAEAKLTLLQMVFNLAATTVETIRTDRYDVHLVDEMYDLKEKLGINNIVKSFYID